MKSFAVFTSYLKERLRQPLPGLEAQIKLAPVNRIKDLKNVTGPLDARESAVLALLFPYKNRDVGILLIKRTVDGSVHSGQISFPGGKKEDCDPDLTATALRETYEETGIPPENVTVLGTLSKIYIHPSNFNVFPYVGYINYEPEVSANSEVEKPLKIPISELLDPVFPVNKEITGKDGNIYSVPCYYIQNEIIWGATAMMLSELLAILIEEHPSILPQ
jgi:8-oxo-dGTP pyrophosphatase MutT (NUDIX family)